MHSADLTINIVLSETYPDVRCCTECCLALMDQQPMDRVMRRAEVDCVVLHNLCACSHLRSVPHIGCLSLVCCTSVFPASDSLSVLNESMELNHLLLIAFLLNVKK